MARAHSFMVKDRMNSLIDELACPNKSNVEGVVSWNLRSVAMVKVDSCFEVLRAGTSSVSSLKLGALQ